MLHFQERGCRCARRIAGLLLVVVLAGCSGKKNDEPVRAVVYGDVTWQGKPVDDGTIRFVSSDGPSAQGPIRNGEYRIEHKGGVPVGECRVEIQGFEEQDIGDSGSTLIQMPRKVGVPIIPKQFNSESNLTVSVDSEKQNQHDFHLEVRQGAAP